MELGDADDTERSMPYTAHRTHDPDHVPVGALQELENLHKLEIVHLENFLDGQVQAGKAMPLKDGYRRKREQLINSSF